MQDAKTLAIFGGCTARLMCLLIILLLNLSGGCKLGGETTRGETTSGGKTTRGETTRGKRLGEEMVWGCTEGPTNLRPGFSSGKS